MLMGTQWCPVCAPTEGLVLQTCWDWLAYTAGPNQATQGNPLGGFVTGSGPGPAQRAGAHGVRLEPAAGRRLGRGPQRGRAYLGPRLAACLQPPPRAG